MIKISTLINNQGIPFGSLAVTKVDGQIFAAASTFRKKGKVFDTLRSSETALARLNQVISGHRSGKNSNLPSLASILNLENCTDLECIDDFIKKAKVIKDVETKSFILTA